MKSGPQRASVTLISTHNQRPSGFKQLTELPCIPSGDHGQTLLEHDIAVDDDANGAAARLISRCCLVGPYRKSHIPAYTNANHLPILSSLAFQSPRLSVDVKIAVER